MSGAYYSHEAEQGDLIMKNVGDKDDSKSRENLV